MELKSFLSMNHPEDIFSIFHYLFSFPYRKPFLIFDVFISACHKLSFKHVIYVVGFIYITV